MEQSGHEENEESLRQESDRVETLSEQEFAEISPEEESDGGETMIRPLSHLPQPEKPIGMSKISQMDRSLSEGANNGSVDVIAIKNYIRNQSNLLTSALSRKISSFKETESVTEFRLNGVRITVLPKEKQNPSEIVLSGRICFFSRSNCRDCSAVRSFFREKNLTFVEINIDVFPSREKELFDRAGTLSVPQIFFNEKLLGGLVALNSLRNSGEFEKRLKDLAGSVCPDSAPRPPLYGFDDEEKDRPDSMIEIVRFLRRRLPIQDRLSVMKLVKNCFSGSDLVEEVIDHLDCGRKKVKYPLSLSLSLTLPFLMELTFFF